MICTVLYIYYRYCVPEPEKEALNCYTGASCDTNTDIVTVQPTPMLVSIGSVFRDFRGH